MKCHGTNLGLSLYEGLGNLLWIDLGKLVQTVV